MIFPWSVKHKVYIKWNRIQNRSEELLLFNERIYEHNERSINRYEAYKGFLRNFTKRPKRECKIVFRVNNLEIPTHSNEQTKSVRLYMTGRSY